MTIENDINKKFERLDKLKEYIIKRYYKVFVRM